MMTVQTTLKSTNVNLDVWLLNVTNLSEDVSPNHLLIAPVFQEMNALNARQRMLVNLQFVSKILMDMSPANVPTTLVTMENHAPKILAILPPENAPTNMLSVLSAFLEDNAQRTSTAKLGLSRMIMI
jgi:hypothetical protein